MRNIVLFIVLIFALSSCKGTTKQEESVAKIAVEKAIEENEKFAGNYINKELKSLNIK